MRRLARRPCRDLLLPAAIALAGAACHPAKGARAPGGDADPVAAAALPYAIVDGHTGGAVAEADFWAALGSARLVCVGEEHPDPHSHWAQRLVVDHLGAARTSGFGLGMEMVQRPFQAVLDDFAAGRIDAAAMRSRVGWEERWGFDWALYAPVLDAAVAHGAALLALNAAQELTKKVVHEGLEALTPEERAGIAADLVLDDPTHRAWFDQVMSDMGGAAAHTSPHEPEVPHDAIHEGVVPAAPSADRIYTVQVIWDETMAETAARWIAGGDRQLVVIAGDGHCHDSAIVGRAKRRGVAPAVSVRPIVDDGEGDVAQAILEHRNDYLLVMSPKPQ